MEEGVINAMLKGSTGSLFDTRSMLSDVSGAGNNWAHGHHAYGTQYGADIMELVRRETEQCDSLQGFLLTHSLGGGTGSGLGTYLLGRLHDHYPEMLRFSVSLFPSHDDDVVTSPYNSVLALNELIEHADAVLPIENQALHDVVAKVDKHVSRSSTGSRTSTDIDLISSGKKPYDRMNTIAANVILNLTSGMRFEGMLNVDMNDISMNMVPFPRHHFLLPSMSPLVVSKAPANSAQRAIDRLFFDVVSRDNQLIKCDPRSSTYLACGLLARGRISGADVARNIATLRPSMQLAYWNQEGFKVGLCDRPPLDAANSLLCLANNCCISDTFAAMLQRFDKLFSRNVYVHHYARYMDVQAMAEAKANVLDTMHSYADHNGKPAPDHLDIYEPWGLNLEPV